MENQKNIKYTIIITIAITIITTIVAFFFLFQKQLTNYKTSNIVTSDQTNEDLSSKTISTRNTGDTFADLQQTSELINIQNLIKQGENKQAIIETEKLLNKTTSKEEKETLELYTANQLMSSDKEQGINYYKKIYDDVTNSKINRAYALLKVEQYSIGENKIAYVKEFLSEEELALAKNDDDIYNIINNKIIKLYPFSISISRIGKYTLEHKPEKETADEIYKLYKDQIEEGNKEMMQYEGLRHLLANSNLNQAQLWASMEKYNTVKTEETQKVFEQAYENGKLYSPRETLQFIVLAYANYHAERNNYDKVNKLIEFLINEHLDPNVVNSLKNAKAENFYIYIQKYYKDTKKFNSFFAQFGW